MSAPRSVLDTPWLTVLEAAQRARRGKRTVYRALAEGELRGNQSTVGGAWTIHVDDLDAWVRGEIAEVELPSTARGRRRAS